VENSFELLWIDVVSMIFSDPLQGLMTPVGLIGYKKHRSTGKQYTNFLHGERLEKYPYFVFSDITILSKNTY
jgi:hypothetical protein